MSKKKYFKDLEKILWDSKIYDLDLSYKDESIALWIESEHYPEEYRAVFRGLKSVFIQFRLIELVSVDDSEKDEIYETFEAWRFLSIAGTKIDRKDNLSISIGITDCGLINILSKDVFYHRCDINFGPSYWDNNKPFIRPNLDELAQVEKIVQGDSLNYQDNVFSDLVTVFSDAAIIDLDISRWQKLIEVWVVSEKMWMVTLPDDHLNSRLPILRIQFIEVYSLRLDFDSSPVILTPWNTSKITFQEKDGLISVVVFGDSSPRIEIVCEGVEYCRGTDIVLDTLFPGWDLRAELARPGADELAKILSQK